MDFNTIAYLIYLSVMTFITVIVGFSLFKNGRFFILKQLNGEEELTDFINKILLVGYYLMNLGYCFYLMSQWNSLTGWTELFNSLSGTVGGIVLLLGTMHFINIAILFLLGKELKNKSQIYSS